MPLRWAVCLFRPPKGTASSLEVHPAACPAELQDQLATRGTACLRPRGAHILYERVDDAGQGAFTPPVLIYLKRLPLCNGLEVCIKRTLITHFVGRAIREAHLQVQLNHPHLLPAYASVRGRHHYYLVLPAAEGDLWAEAEVMRQHGTGYSEDELRAVARQMLLGLEHLHASQLAHRDIKPANLLRLPDGRVVVADFGCTDGCTAGFVAAGTTQFQPPECRRHASAQLAVLPKGYDQRLQDMWSVGATLACLWYARMPEVTRGSLGPGGGGGGGGGGLSRNNSRGALRASGLSGGNSAHKRRSANNIAVPPPRPLPPLPLPLPPAASAPVAASAGLTVTLQAEKPAPAPAPAMVATAADGEGADPIPASAAAASDAAEAATPLLAPTALAPAANRPPRPPAPTETASAGSAVPRFLAAAGFAGCSSTVGARGVPMSPELLDLLSGLLHARPSDRVTASQALQHPWLAVAAAIGAGAGGNGSASVTCTVAPVTPAAAALASPPPPLSTAPSGASSSSSASPSKGGLRDSGDGRFPSPFRSIHYLLAHRSSAPGDAPPGGAGQLPDDTPREDAAGDGADGGADPRWTSAARRARRETADPDVRPEDLRKLRNRAHGGGGGGGGASSSTGIVRTPRHGSIGAEGPSSYEGPSSAGAAYGSGGADPTPFRRGPGLSISMPSPRGASPSPSPSPAGSLPPLPPLAPPSLSPHSHAPLPPQSPVTSPWLRPSLPPGHPLGKLGSRREVLRVFVGAGSEASGST